MAGLTAWLFRRATTMAQGRQHRGAHWDERKKVFLECTEAHFRIKDGLAESHLAWDMVLYVREVDASFYVFTTPECFHVIPKRVLPTPEALTTLRQLLTGRVAEGGECVLAEALRPTWLPFALYLVAFALLAGVLVEAAGSVFG